MTCERCGGRDGDYGGICYGCSRLPEDPRKKRSDVADTFQLIHKAIVEHIHPYVTVEKVKIGYDGEEPEPDDSEEL